MMLGGMWMVLIWGVALIVIVALLWDLPGKSSGKGRRDAGAQ